MLLIRKWVSRGAIVGTAVAIIMISLDNLRLFSIPVNDFIDREIFRLCPFYILGFTTFVHSMGAIVVLTIFGNAILYGAVFGVIAAVISLIKRLAGSPAS